MESTNRTAAKRRDSKINQICLKNKIIRFTFEEYRD
jgi:hypothetical protein